MIAVSTSILSVRGKVGACRSVLKNVWLHKLIKSNMGVLLRDGGQTHVRYTISKFDISVQYIET